MDSTKTITFSLLLFSLLIPGRTAITCTDAVCRRGDPVIHFPFHIKTRQPESCGYRGFDLTCNNNDGNADNAATTITLPSGDFTVEHIDYAAQEILINDPNNCLPRRILTLNLSTTPFNGVYTRPFSFFNCSTPDYLRFRPLNPIACLSSENGTVFATASPSEVNHLSKSCRFVKRVDVPVRWAFYGEQVASSDLSENLWLSWRVPRCRSCENRGGRCGITSDSTRDIVCSNLPKSGISMRARYAIAIGAGIPGSLFIFGILCFIYGKIESFVKRRHLGSNPDPNNQAHLHQPNQAILGLNGPTIESYPKIVLGESKRLPKSDDATCPICLTEYEPMETLRTIPTCQHWFHADCIDEWLKSNATCPVCRDSPEKSTPALEQNLDSF